MVGWEDVLVDSSIGGPSIERLALEEGAWLYKVTDYDWCREESANKIVFVPPFAATGGEPLSWEYLGDRVSVLRCRLPHGALYWYWKDTAEPSLLFVPAGEA